MKRREIMTAALTWAVLDEASVLHASSVPASKLVVVGAGADRWGNPLRAGGFGWVKVSSKDTGGRLVDVRESGRAPRRCAVTRPSSSGGVVSSARRGVSV